MSSNEDVKVQTIYKFIGAIYRAIYKEIGDDAWEILWRSGEILFDSIKNDVSISKENDLQTALNKLSKFLRDTHIVSEINYMVDKDNGVIEYQINFAVPLKYERREEAGPVYIFSSLFVALMKYLGYDVSKDAEPRFTSDNTLIERWRYKKKG